MIGRAGALLVDIGIDTVPRGYRMRQPAAAPSSAAAASLLDEDIDALEEAWEKAGLRGGTRTVKVQAPGPITLAAQLELPGGHRAITDPGAVRDLAGSLAEGWPPTARSWQRRLGHPGGGAVRRAVAACRTGGQADRGDQPDAGAPGR